MKTAISVPDPIFAKVEEAAARLGVSRSEFFARAAERWLGELDDDGTTEAIDRALQGLPDEDTEFAARAARSVAQASEW